MPACSRAFCILRMVEKFPFTILSAAPQTPASPPAESQNCRLLSIRYKCRMIRLTDEQWERIRMHFPEEHIPDGRPGRKPIPTRRILEAVLWILNTGAQWHMLPQQRNRGFDQLHRWRTLPDSTRSVATQLWARRYLIDLFASWH